MQVQTVTTATIPGYQIYEYLLVLSPHKELWDKITEVKKKFADDYQSEQARWGKPHITIVNFVQYTMMEERIINRLNAIAMGFPPFKIEMRDFGSFPSHTIFINVVSKIPIQNLVKEVRRESQKLMRLNDDNKPHFITEPHLPIVRKLQPWQYEKGWLEYSNKHFTGRFIADSMLLLKRPIIEPDAPRMKYQVAQRFQFQNLPVSTKQGDLFR